MDFSNLDFISKFINTQDLMTVFVLWSLMKKRISGHFKSIEASLVKIGDNLNSLKESIIKLEKEQTKRINDLSKRVTDLEKKGK